MTKYTKDSIETATKVASTNGKYLCGEFDEEGVMVGLFGIVMENRYD